MKTRQSIIDPLLRPEDLQELLGCSRRSVYRHMASGEIPAARRIGGLVRWHRDDIEGWLRRKRPVRINEEGEVEHAAQ